MESQFQTVDLESRLNYIPKSIDKPLGISIKLSEDLKLAFSDNNFVRVYDVVSQTFHSSTVFYPNGQVIRNEQPGGETTKIRVPKVYINTKFVDNPIRKDHVLLSSLSFTSLEWSPVGLSNNNESLLLAIHGNPNISLLSLTKTEGQHELKEVDNFTHSIPLLENKDILNPKTYVKKDEYTSKYYSIHGCWDSILYHDKEKNNTSFGLLYLLIDSTLFKYKIYENICFPSELLYTQQIENNEIGSHIHIFNYICSNHASIPIVYYITNKGTIYIYKYNSMILSEPPQLLHKIENPCLFTDYIDIQIIKNNKEDYFLYFYSSIHLYIYSLQMNFSSSSSFFLASTLLHSYIFNEEIILFTPFLSPIDSIPHSTSCIPLYFTPVFPHSSSSSSFFSSFYFVTFNTSLYRATSDIRKSYFELKFLMNKNIQTIINEAICSKTYSPSFYIPLIYLIINSINNKELSLSISTSLSSFLTINQTDSYEIIYNKMVFAHILCSWFPRIQFHALNILKQSDQYKYIILYYYYLSQLDILLSMLQSSSSPLSKSTSIFILLPHLYSSISKEYSKEQSVQEFIHSIQHIIQQECPVCEKDICFPEDHEEGCFFNEYLSNIDPYTLTYVTCPSPAYCPICQTVYHSIYTSEDILPFSPSSSLYPSSSLSSSPPPNESNNTTVSLDLLTDSSSIPHKFPCFPLSCCLFCQFSLSHKQVGHNNKRLYNYIRERYEPVDWEKFVVQCKKGKRFHIETDDDNE
ncbi:hypothetical protein WA158_002085 [Blastocystis sp. Blastoise]